MSGACAPLGPTVRLARARTWARRRDRRHSSWFAASASAVDGSTRRVARVGGGARNSCDVAQVATGGAVDRKRSPLSAIKKDEVDGKQAYLADFELKSVPPGEYTLKTWNKKLAETSRHVVVEAGKALTVDLVLEK